MLKTTMPHQAENNDDDSVPVERFDVESDAAGQRIDVLLGRTFDFIPSRSFASRIIERGAVKVNEKSVKASYKCTLGDVVTIDTGILETPGASPKAEKIPLAVLYEDKDVLVINKPAGLVVHPGAGNPNGTLVNAVLGHCGHTLPSLGEEARAGIVHRLDRDTSGVMVVAKTQIALTSLSQQFAQHTQERWYSAIVYGHPNPSRGTLETWHGRDKNHRIRFAVLAQGEGKIARMRYSTTEEFCEGKASLVRCELLTGRTHQIRVQMKHIGCPLLGDPLYTSDYAKLRTERLKWQKLEPLLTRQMLHAELLQFEHPTSHNLMKFVAPPPDDFLQVAKILQG
jgi:23S rRNA pseudouridine1911/1915/1917 synthase